MSAQCWSSCGLLQLPKRLKYNSRNRFAWHAPVLRRCRTRISYIPHTVIKEANIHHHPGRRTTLIDERDTVQGIGVDDIEVEYSAAIGWIGTLRPILKSAWRIMADRAPTSKKCMFHHREYIPCCNGVGIQPLVWLFTWSGWNSVPNGSTHGADFFLNATQLQTSSDTFKTTKLNKLGFCIGKTIVCV